MGLVFGGTYPDRDQVPPAAGAGSSSTTSTTTQTAAEPGVQVSSPSGAEPMDETQLLLVHLVRSDEVIRRVVGHLTDDDFDVVTQPSALLIWSASCEHYRKFGTVAPRAALEGNFAADRSSLNAEEQAELAATVGMIYGYPLSGLQPIWALEAAKRQIQKRRLATLSMRLQLLPGRCVEIVRQMNLAVAEAEAVTAVEMAPDDQDEPPAWGDFDLGLWHVRYRELLEQLADSTATHPSVGAMNLPTTLGATIGNRVYLRATDDFRTSSAIWSVHIAPPGDGKSPPRRRLVEPISRYEEDCRLHRSQKIAAHAQQVTAYKQQVANAKVGAVQTAAMLPAGAVVPQVPLQPPANWQDPPLEIFRISDLTMESLRWVLTANPRGCLYDPDEFKELMASINRYREGGRGGDLERLCKIYDNEDLTVTRANAEDKVTIIRRPFLAIVGGLQTLRVPQITQDNDFGPSGMLARLNLIKTPIDNRPWMGAIIDNAVWRDYAKAVYALMDLPMDLRDPDRPVPNYVRLDDAALPAYIAFYNKCKETKVGTVNPLERALWGKLAEKALRWTLVFHCSDWAMDLATGQTQTRQPSASVGLPTLRRGVAAAQWMHDRTLAVYRSHELDTCEESAIVEQLLAVMRKEAINQQSAVPGTPQAQGLTPQEVRNKGVGQTNRQVARLLEDLVAASKVIRSVAKPSVGRPSVRYRIA